MAQAILQLEKITKDYKVADSAVHALRGVSLNFRSKEFVAVLGHSGCGKTTLLNIIGGLDHYTSGDLVIKGRSTKGYKDGDWDAYRNHSIGFVFQSYNLIPHQTVLENVELALTLSGIRPQERKARAKQALERVGLGGELNKRPNQLSGGQMQRVAIARALVNNPEILLADEPTGALDSATSVQIMDLIREIAGERLVIMVTHNPELAKRYASRIVELKDGQIVGDSDPFEPDEVYVEEGTVAANASAAEQRRARRALRKSREKTSMSFWTAFMLSGRNLLTKKGRTAVTSIAGSIGIISVCLVLALSNGFNNYIRKTEEDMLSYYPLEITETSLDPTSIMAGLQSAGDMPDLSELDNKVYVNSFLTQIAQGLTVANEITQDGYIEYLESMPEEWYYAITKDTGATLVDNLFTTVTTGVGDDAKKEIRSLSSLKQYFINVLEDQEEKYAQMAYLVDYLGSVVNTMPGTSNFDKVRDAYGDYVLSQYDILNEGGEFPQGPNEAVLVVGTNNDMTDLLLAQLGYITEDDFLSLFELGGGETEDYDPDDIGDYLSFSFKDLTEKEFTLYFNDAVYQRNEDYTMPGSGHAFNYVGERTDLDTNGGEDGVEIKITAVLRLKDGLTYGCLSRGLNLTEELVEEYVQENMQSQIVQWMNTTIDINNMESVAGGGRINFGEGDAGTTIYLSPSAHLNGTYYSQITDAQRQEIEAENPELGPLLDFLQELYISNSIGVEQAIRSLGGNDAPNSIAIYPRDFDTKEEILAYLDAWNTDADASADDGKTAVQYTDTVGLLMGMVQTILDAITYVLVAFTAISLVVSTVMIGAARHRRAAQGHQARLQRRDLHHRPHLRLLRRARRLPVSDHRQLHPDAAHRHRGAGGAAAAERVYHDRHQRGAHPHLRPRARFGGRQARPRGGAAQRVRRFLSQKGALSPIFWRRRFAAPRICGIIELPKGGACLRAARIFFVRNKDFAPRFVFCGFDGFVGRFAASRRRKRST